MAQVTITVNGRDYPIACDDGEEQQVMQLADKINGYVDQVVGSVGQMGQSHLILMVALLLADELEEIRAGGASAEAADFIDGLETRLAGIAERLESA